MSLSQPVTQQGDAINWTCAFKRPDPDHPNQRIPVDLTGYGTISAAIHPETQNRTPIPFTVDASQAAAGVLVLTMTGADAAALVAGSTYPFRIEGSSDLGPLAIYTNRVVVQ